MGWVDGMVTSSASFRNASSLTAGVMVGACPGPWLLGPTK